MAKYTVTVQNDNGLMVGSYEISTEYDHDVEDLDAHGDFDHYITHDEFDRLGPMPCGKSIGEEIVKDIATNEKWEW